MIFLAGMAKARSVGRDGMSTGETTGPIHPVPTRRSRFRYQFYVKHHRGDRTAAQWSLSQEVEFGVFDRADFHDISDKRGNLYGIGRNAEGEVLELGMLREQIAKFPYVRPDEIPLAEDSIEATTAVEESPYDPAYKPWHGYPLWPLRKPARHNRSKPVLANRTGQVSRPSKDVFQKMQDEGLIRAWERGRLEKGDFL
jgi:hypothetical protein